MPNESSKFAIERILQSDADEIIAARGKATAIHRTRNIGAAGSEVEQAVRKVLTRKLSQMYDVGHGHIVDSSLATSPQLDVV
jgi:hypothetical protein